MMCANYNRSARVLHFVDVTGAISFLCRMGQIQMMIKVMHRSRSDKKKKKKKERKKEEEFRKTERRSIVGVLHLSVRLLYRQSLCLSHSQ